MPLTYYDFLYTYRKRILQNRLHVVRRSIKCILLVEVPPLIGWHVIIQYFYVVVSIWSLLFVHLTNRMHQLMNDNFSLKIYNTFTISNTLSLSNAFCSLHEYHVEHKQRYMIFLDFNSHIGRFEKPYIEMLFFRTYYFSQDYYIRILVSQLFVLLIKLLISDKCTCTSTYICTRAFLKSYRLLSIHLSPDIWGTTLPKYNKRRSTPWSLDKYDWCIIILRCI